MKIATIPVISVREHKEVKKTRMTKEQFRELRHLKNPGDFYEILDERAICIPNTEIPCWYIELRRKSDGKIFYFYF